MKTLFFLIILGAIGYFGYSIIQNDKTIGPPVKDFFESVKTNIGLGSITELNHCAVRVVSPIQMAQVTDPVSVEVIIDNSKDGCSWTVFEGNGGLVELRDKNNKLLAKDTLKADGDWMTSAPTTYRTSVAYEGYSGSLLLSITESNPEGTKTPGRVVRTLVTAN